MTKRPGPARGSGVVPRRPVIDFRRDRGDRIAAGVLVIVSLVLLRQSINYALFTAGHAPGPGLFPAIVSALLLLLAVLWLVTGAGKDREIEPANEETIGLPPVAAPGSDRPAVSGDSTLLAPPGADAVETAIEDADEITIDAAGRRRIIFVFLWTLVPLLLLDRIGYVFGITLYVAGLLIVVARTRPWVALVGSLVGAALTQVGAAKLGISLPDPLNLLLYVGM
jgi:hypothetical protein